MVPIFIVILFCLVSVFYTVTLVYLQQQNGISLVQSAIWFIVYVAVIVGIFLGIPYSYDQTINESRDDYKKYKEEPILSDKLKEKWVDSVSSKNKYFISWFIVLLYVPILFHYNYRCDINPLVYNNIYAFFKQQFSFLDEDDGIPKPFVEPASGVLNIIKEIDKLNIKYTTEETDLFNTIKKSIELKEDLKLNDKQILILKKLRYHIEKNRLWSRLKNISIPTESIQGVQVDSTVLYIFNVCIISIVCVYIFIYDYSKIYFILPLFTVCASFAIYYLQ
jgi:hypothetical protein